MSALTQEALAVYNALVLKGLENNSLINESSINRRDCINLIEDHMLSIMNLLGLNIIHDSLLGTPKRIAKMYVEEIFLGLNYLNFPKITILKNTMQIDEMITVRNINITSVCEHHFIIFSGKVTVSYIPNDNIIGLSKINKIIHFFSKRPQLQERLTNQIFLALQTLLNTENVAVFINAEHYCMKARSVHDIASTVNTVAVGGLFKSNSSTRREFFHTVTIL